MINPYYFTGRALQVGFIVTVYSHHTIHANSKITIRPNYKELGIGTR